MVYIVSFHSSELTDTLTGYSEPSGASSIIEDRLLWGSVFSIADTGQEVKLLHGKGSESSL